jgi:hypothetical protein
MGNGEGQRTLIGLKSNNFTPHTADGQAGKGKSEVAGTQPITDRLGNRLAQSHWRN